MVMDGGVEAYAVGASDEMATVGGVEMSAASTSTVRTGRGSDELRRAEEEVKGEGGDIVSRQELRSGKAVGDRDARGSHADGP